MRKLILFVIPAVLAIVACILVLQPFLRVRLKREYRAISPLMVAITENKKVAVIEAIVRNNPSLIRQDEDFGKDRNTGPLYVAAYMQRTDVVECLLLHGADADLATNMLFQTLGTDARSAINLIDVQRTLLGAKPGSGREEEERGGGQ